MHCISVILAKLKDIKLIELPTGWIDDSIRYEYLNQDIIAVSSPEDLLPDSEYLVVSTNYFGGFGEQDAALCRNHVCIKNYDDEWHSINQALKEFGVLAEDGQDEFDTIHLGRYRDNYDFSFNAQDVPDLVRSLKHDDQEEDLKDIIKQVCECGNDTFHVYKRKVLFDDARLFCSKCEKEWN